MDFAVGNLSWSSNQLVSNFYMNSNNLEPQGNTCLSTLGITSLLTMIQLSSWNSSSLHMKECLNGELQKILGFAFFKEYLDSVVSEDKNQIFRQKIFAFYHKNMTVSKYFNQIMQQIFHIDFIPIDFAAINASAVINEHIGDFSDRKVTQFVKDGTLSADMKVALFNGIYFKGEWQHKFFQKYTTMQEFEISSGKTVPVNMMFARQKFCVKDDNNLEYSSIKIPYVDKHQDMYILLPNKRNSLFQLEKKLSPEFIQSFLSQTNCQEKLTELYLPKFKLESNFDMDMITFIPQGWIVERRKLTKMWHQTTIDVSEGGTEAVATSGAVNGLMGPLATRFLVDHPFLFFIVDQKFKIVIFIGRVVNPNQGKK